MPIMIFSPVSNFGDQSLEGKNRIKGGRGGSKMTQKNRTSFMNDPLFELKKLPSEMRIF